MMKHRFFFRRDDELFDFFNRRCVFVSFYMHWFEVRAAILGREIIVLSI